MHTAKRFLLWKIPVAENSFSTEVVLMQFAYILVQKALKSGVYADTKSQKPSIPRRNCINEILLNGKSCFR
jgi:hypothetical protein